MSLKIILSFFLVFKTYSVDVFFTPSLDCENHIIQEINAAKKSVDVAVYSINNTNIVSAITSAHKSGIKIRILTDNIQAAGSSSKVIELAQAGLDLRIHSVNKIMHNKFAIFDNTSTITGSFNWTNPASTQNNENCVLFSKTDIGVIERYQQEFEKLWKLNTEQKSKIKVANIIKKRGSKRTPAAKTIP